jgi:hypothetical protein
LKRKHLLFENLHSQLIKAKIIKGVRSRSRRDLLMHKPKIIFRTGLIAILVFSIILCSFTSGMVRYNTSQATPFQTLPPVNATLSTPIGALTPVPTPIPTLGPGQYFEEGDLRILIPSYIEGGDEANGYGPLAGKPGLYLMWVTTEDSKRYLIVEDDNEILLGRIDEATDKRMENGFDDYIQQLDDKNKELELKQIEVNGHQRKRYDSHTVAVGIAFVGGLACTIFTAGACIFAFGTAALAAWGTGVYANGERATAQEELDSLQSDYDDIYDKVLGKFEQALSTSSKP